MAYNTMAHPDFLYQRSGGEDIDLGLSLCPSLQQESFHQPSERFLSPNEYGELMGWPQLQPFLKHSNISRCTASEEDDDVTQGVQSKERWSYVKVNMEGVVIGRKICIVDHTNYSSLAVELEEMAILWIWVKVVGSRITLFSLVQGQERELEDCRRCPMEVLAFSIRKG
ncbi:Iaa32p [Asimina triloba]